MAPFRFESNQIQVLLSNGNAEKTVQVNTSVVTEIRKNICYTSTNERGTEKLKITFMHEGNEPVEDYFSPDESYKIQATLRSGECKEFYLAYNVPYFYDFIVMPSTAQEDIVEFGLHTNWNEGFVYNFDMNSPNGLDFDADLVIVHEPEYPGQPVYYKIKMSWSQISPDTILVSPLP